MSFENPSSPENIKQEPTLNEIYTYLDNVVGFQDYAEISRKEDEAGLRDLSVEDRWEKGTVYDYSRRIDKGGNVKATVDIVYFEGEDVVGGRHIATYKEGVWQ